MNQGCTCHRGMIKSLLNQEFRKPILNEQKILNYEYQLDLNWIKHDSKCGGIAYDRFQENCNNFVFKKNRRMIKT